MNKYIVIAFAFMGVWFYEASGGADFQPGSNSLVVFADPEPILPRDNPRTELVARADTTGAALTDVTPSRLLATPESAADSVPTLAISRMEPVAVSEPEPAGVQEVATMAQPKPADPEPVADLSPDYRFVDADSVNLRGGPGTDYAVLGRLLRYEMVEVLEDSGDGWLHLRVSASGEEGWMADWLVTAAN